MAIRFVCPLGHRLKVPDERAGKKGRCPVCGQRLIVPHESLPGRAPSAVGEEPFDDAKALNEPDVTVDPPIEFFSLETPDKQSTTVGAAAAASEPESPPPVPMPPLPPLAPAIAAIASPPPLPPVAQVRPPQGEQGSGGVQPAGSGPHKRLVRWVSWARADALEPFTVYRANPRQLEIAYWLACLLPFAVLFCAAPALPYLQFGGAPLWSQAMLSAAGLQLAFAAWLALLPDWSTVRVGAFFFAASAAAYLVGMIATAFLAEPQLSSLGLNGVRWSAVAWCGLAVVVSSLASAACGLVSSRWREAEHKPEAPARNSVRSHSSSGE